MKSIFKKISNKSQFFFKHLLISYLITVLLIGIVFFIWYPSPLASAVGVTHIFLMMLAIDVIVGPLLGWLVYKEGKKTLKLDLSVIIFLQIAALLFGLFSIEQGRPVWIAYNVDRFELVRKNDLIMEHLDQVKIQFQKPSLLYSQYVCVEFAQDKLQRENDMFAEALGGISIAQKPERYVDFTKALPQIKKHAKSLNNLEQFNDHEQVRKILVKYPQATGYIPLKANAIDMTVLVNKEGEVVKIVDLRPWN